jgi:hypothetical protein
MERDIVATPGGPHPVSYHCSECGWNFTFKRLSFVIEYFEEREAQASFRNHKCANYPLLEKTSSSRHQANESV